MKHGEIQETPTMPWTPGDFWVIGIKADGGGEGGWREKGGEGDGGGGGGGSGKPRPPTNQDQSKQCIKLYDGSTFEFSSGKFGDVYQNNPPSILFNPAKPYYGHKLYQNILMRRLM